ncbi:MAG: S41 family peptidase [Cyclobacteriaceae bacterium]
MKRFSILFSILMITNSCEQLILDDELVSVDPKTNFDYLWNECNTKYAYFDVKNIDWNQVYDQYSPLISSEMSQDSLFQVMLAMLLELKDAHTNLVSSFNISFYQIDLVGQDNFDFRILEENYLPSNYYISGPFVHDFLSGEEVGYIRFGSFSGDVDNVNLDFVLDRYRNTKGLILDLRENGGGTPTDMFRLLSRFIDQRTLIYYSRIKEGPGKNDFSTPEAAYIDPHEGLRYNKPIMMLVDRGTYSAGSFTALATKAIPNITLLGDTTGGGLGAPNGGQLPNGWTYRFSISQTLTLDNDPSYENGVPPDILAYFDWTDLSKDEVLDAAIRQIVN